ncbi:MAG: hypothetical protein JO060_11935 [Candidatus Eremiobacteraeota bacterium]|nr:hypothetical protein [Candidatus Eremiobacteraeota bacterium]
MLKHTLPLLAIVVGTCCGARAAVTLPRHTAGTVWPQTEQTQLSPQGGVLRAHAAGIAEIAFGYGRNDAVPGTAVAARPLFASTGGTRPPVVRVQLDVSGNRIVTFADAFEAATLSSPMLRAGIDYRISLSSAGHELGVQYEAGKPVNGALHFASPLSALSLRPATPLLVSAEPLAVPPESASASVTAVLERSGDSLAVPPFASFAALSDYAQNDAPAAATVTLINSGGRNVTNAVTPETGSVTLFLQFRLESSRSVRFANAGRTSVAPFSPYGSPSIRLRSPLLVPGSAAEAYLFAAGRLTRLGTTTVSADGELRIPSPLSGAMVVPAVPVVVEIVSTGQRSGAPLIAESNGHHHHGKPTPTPSPSPTPTGSPSPTPTPTPSMTPLPSPTPTVTPTATPTPTPTATPTAISHVVVMVQENRSVDALFNGYPGADTVTVDPYTGTQLTQVSMGGTQGAWDPNHAHFGAFTVECAASGSGPCTMLGFSKETGGCPQPGASYCTAYAYAPPSETTGYFSLAQRGVFYDEVFQSNNGPSFPAHQYFIAGQAGGYNPDGTINSTYPYTWAENGYGGTQGGTYCGAPSTKRVAQIDVTMPYPGKVAHDDFPCLDYPTIFDELPSGYTWHYYSNSVGGFWAAPNSVRHLYGTSGSPNLTTVPSAVLSDISAGTLANLVYVIPTYNQSDHPGPGHVATAGSDWVNSVVNAIETSSYANSTLVLITWDDWGGWYDHVIPPTWFNANAYGFRVPSIAIGPGLPAGTVDHTVRNQSAFLLQTIEKLWNLPSLNQEDAQGPGIMNALLHRPRRRTPWRLLPVQHPPAYYFTHGGTNNGPGDD